MKPRRRLPLLLSLVATTATLTAGCSGGGAEADNKAGGSGGPVVLKLANSNGDIDFTPAVANFAKKVEEVSGGNLLVEVVDDWGGGTSDAEQQVVHDVAAGNVDLGWAGTRVFDTLGVKSFQALSAPMLVDSYALEDALIEKGITAEMMSGLEGLKVTGLSVLPDGLRRPAGVDGPLLGPADWEGIAFGTLMSNAQAEAIRALGARPDQVHRQDREDRLKDGRMQGFETSFLVHQHNPALTPLAPYMTANVVLWPQMDVLMANPARLNALTDEQRSWLEEAAQDAAAGASAVAAIDSKALSDSCRVGGRFAQASEADVAALKSAFDPVYATLQQDPKTKGFIQRITMLKESTAPEPAVAVPADCTGPAPQRASDGNGNAPAELNGTYRYVLTKEAARKAGDPELNLYPITNTWALEDGHFEVAGDYGGFTGTYWVEGNRFTLAPLDAAYTTTFTFTIDEKGNIDFDPVPGTEPGDAFTFGTDTIWTKID